MRAVRRPSSPRPVLAGGALLCLAVAGPALATPGATDAAGPSAGPSAGTVHIFAVEDALDDTRGNVPQAAGCALRVQGSGFTAGPHTALVSVTGRKGDTDTPLPTTPASVPGHAFVASGGAQDFDLVYVVDPAGVTVQEHGLHVRVDVDVDGVGKTKTIWLIGCTSGGGQDGVDDGTDDGLDDGTDDGLDGGTDDGLDGGTDDGLDDGTDDGLDDGTDDGLDDGTDDGVDDGVDDGTDDGLDDRAGGGVDDDTGDDTGVGAGGTQTPGSGGTQPPGSGGTQPPGTGGTQPPGTGSEDGPDPTQPSAPAVQEDPTPDVTLPAAQAESVDAPARDALVGVPFLEPAPEAAPRRTVSARALPRTGAELPVTLAVGTLLVPLGGLLVSWRRRDAAGAARAR